MEATRPYVIVFSTASLDGRIASSTGYSRLSCEYDLARLRLLRGMVEAVMVGANTVLVDNPRLVDRYEPKTSKYYRIVVDGRLRLHSGLRIFREKEPRVIVVTSSRGSRRARELEEAGAIILEASGPRGIDLKSALSRLYREYGVEKLLVEGGGILSYSLLSQRLVDEIRVTYTGVVFAAGRSMFEDPLGAGFPDAKSSPKLRLECFEPCPCGNCVHIVYRVLDSSCCPPRVELEKCLSEKLKNLLDEALYKKHS